MKTTIGQRWQYKNKSYCLNFIVELVSELRPGILFPNQIDGKIINGGNQGTYKLGATISGFTPFPADTCFNDHYWKYLRGQDATERVELGVL